MNINEAIRRNPYDPNLYQLRIRVNGALDNKKAEISDIVLINNFINRKPIQSFKDSIFKY